jgi:hypothetical protein
VDYGLPSKTKHMPTCFFLFEVPLGKEYIIVSKLSWEV